MVILNKGNGWKPCLRNTNGNWDFWIYLFNTVLSQINALHIQEIKETEKNEKTKAKIENKKK
jgi:hypothetical protein